MKFSAINIMTGVAFVFLLLCRPAFSEDAGSLPSLEVRTFNANGTQALANVEVTIEDASDNTDAPEPVTLATDAQGVATFGPDSFDGYNLKKPDMTSLIYHTGDESSGPLDGIFKVKVTAKPANMAAQSYDIDVPGSQLMRYRIHMSPDEY